MRTTPALSTVLTTTALFLLETVSIHSPSMMAAPAELIIQNAHILTVDTNLPDAQALAISGNRFVFVGSNSGLSRFTGAATRVLDLTGRTVVPGFIDAHAHPGPEYPENSPWASVDCRPEKVRTIEQLVDALRRKAEGTPPGQWVIGSRYQETKLGRHPTRWDLDRASTNHPIIISHSSGHQSVANSLALRLGKIAADTPDPPGGKFVRDDRGEITGLLQERAAAIVRAAGPARSGNTGRLSSWVCPISAPRRDQCARGRNQRERSRYVDTRADA